MKTLFLLLGLYMGAQNVSVAIYQDAKFLFIGDKERGYEAGTIDIVARLKMQGNQDKYGYLIVFPEYEYAEIEGIYKRYSANVGYTFNKLILDRFEANISLGYGWIDRYSMSSWSFGASSELTYKITDRLKFNLLLQGTERKDLEVLWGNNAFRISGFIGIEVNLL